jgi:hypothetical protein
MLTGMADQTQAYGLIPQRVMKHWSRCLIGRFGLRFRQWHKFGPCYPPDIRLIRYIDDATGEATDLLMAGTQMLLLGDVEESPESLPQIPGWVMSECRARLWESMQIARTRNGLLYVDTDSVIVTAEAAESLRNYWETVYFKWVLKGSYNKLTINGPRNLYVGDTRRISGLPLTARQSGELDYSGEVMRSIKQSMKTGDFNVITEIPRQFHIAPRDLRRQHNPNGSTSPFIIEESDAISTDG